MYFSKEQLKQKDDTIEEHWRCRFMFETLKNACRQNKSLTEAEKEFVLHALEERLSSESVFYFAALQTALFRRLTLNYYSGRYNLGERYSKLLNGKLETIPYGETIQDLQFLFDHSTKLLDGIAARLSSHQSISEQERELIMEFRFNRKQLTSSQQFKNDIVFRSSKRCAHEFKVIRIGVVYSYYKLLEYQEDWTNFPRNIQLNKTTFLISLGRILHVFNRHFSPTMKFQTDKSHFRSDFIMPDDLPDVIEEVVQLRDRISPLYASKYTIHFRRKNQCCTILLNEKKGVLQIGTMYPEYDETNFNLLTYNLQSNLVGEFEIFV